MYLLDTNIISLSAPGRSVGAMAVADWVRQNHEAIFLSVVTVTAIEQGIAQLRRRASIQKAASLSDWLATVLRIYGAKLLPLDLSAALMLGDLVDRSRSAGKASGYPDLIIAATASVHGLTVLTRNTRHFEGLGVPIHDPYDTLPGTAQ